MTYRGGNVVPTGYHVCIEILRGRNPTLQERLRQAGQENVAICAIVRAELLCGARLARDPARELARLAVFDELQDYPFDGTAAEQYSLIRVHLQQQGRLIGAYDLLIAAIAPGAQPNPGDTQYQRVQPCAGTAAGRLAGITRRLNPAITVPLNTNVQNG